jgi:SAM-dependent methyltransferase
MHDHSDSDRHGAKQPGRFDVARAARLDDPERFGYLPPAEVLELLGAPQDACVVDFGTGTGTYAIAIAKLRPDLQIFALDEQAGMLELLRNKLAVAPLPKIEPVGAEALPALRGRADRVLAVNVLHELGDVALRGLGELLGPDGRALFVDWNAEVERPVGPPRDHVYTMNDARSRLEESNFLVTEERRFPYHYALTASRKGPSYQAPEGTK